MKSEFFVQLEKLPSFEDWAERWPEAFMHEQQPEEDEDDARRLRRELEAIKRSRSWRLTYPLRELSKVIRRMAQMR